MGIESILWLYFAIIIWSFIFNFYLGIVALTPLFLILYAVLYEKVFGKEKSYNSKSATYVRKIMSIARRVYSRFKKTGQLVIPDGHKGTAVSLPMSDDPKDERRALHIIFDDGSDLELKVTAADMSWKPAGEMPLNVVKALVASSRSPDERQTSFIFTPAPHFVRTDVASYDFIPGGANAEEVYLLRHFYPELKSWGYFALYEAWSKFSEQVKMVQWEPVSRRDEDFLMYCCWRQTHVKYIEDSERVRDIPLSDAAWKVEKKNDEETTK